MREDYVAFLRPLADTRCEKGGIFQSIGALGEFERNQLEMQA